MSAEGPLPRRSLPLGDLRAAPKGAHLNAARIQKWVWIVIYGGMILLALGLAVQRSDAALGWGIAAPGIALIVIGIVLIWLRSRIEDKPETP